MVKIPGLGEINIGGIKAEDVVKLFAKDERLVSLRRLIERQGKLPALTEEREISIRALRPDLKRFHGAKLSLAYFPQSQVTSPCADKYGYIASAAERTATMLPVNLATKTLLGQLGTFMGTTPPSPATES